jgi:hypothetical protein
MQTKSQIKIFILRALLRMDGLPMVEETLSSAVKLALSPAPVKSEIDTARRELEAEGFISGNRDELLETVTWTLTDKGAHRARQLN